MEKFIKKSYGCFVFQMDGASNPAFEAQNECDSHLHVMYFFFIKLILFEMVKLGLFFADCNLFVCCNQFTSLLLHRLLQY